MSHPGLWITAAPPVKGLIGHPTTLCHAAVPRHTNTPQNTPPQIPQTDIGIHTQIYRNNLQAPGAKELRAFRDRKSRQAWKASIVLGLLFS